jgi:DNA-binding Lrp family transcriptional regulator
MTIGFVLISAAPTKEHEVYENLLQIPEIIELYPLFGEFDLITKLETDNYDELGKIVMDRIRTIDGVLNTKTLTGVVF